MNDSFIGEFPHTIDQKGRIIVPSRFREQLGEQQIVISKGLDHCLWIFPETEWDLFSEKIHSLHSTSEEARNITRFFMGGADPQTADKQGRILVSQRLRDYAGLEKDVVLVGASNKIEIWNREAWDRISAQNDSNMDAIAEHLGEIGFGF